MALKQLYSVKDACRILGISQGMLYWYINTGELTSIKIGGKRLIHAQAIAEVIRGERILGKRNIARVAAE